MRPPRPLALLSLLPACAAAAPAPPAPAEVAPIVAPDPAPPPAAADAQPAPPDAGAPAPEGEIVAEPPGDGGAPAPGYLEGRRPPMPVLIQRGVTGSRPKWRRCYQEGLSRNPKLAGKVVVKFVIGREGEVRVAMNSGSDLPDERVVACVVDLFRAMRFPPPEGGLVTVTYPLIFDPGALP